jgi:hypothetical protein
MYPRLSSKAVFLNQRAIALFWASEFFLLGHRTALIYCKIIIIIEIQKINEDITQ